MQAVVFGYKCQECGRGTVTEQLVPEYHTKVRGYPFVVRNAHIGVCDKCGAEHFAAHETERWESMFEKEHERRFLAPQEIQELRKSLGLTMEQFAFLLGCTRQSLHSWERQDRIRAQSRMADVLMKLARRSRDEGEVNVLTFLVQEAASLGVTIRLKEKAGPLPTVREFVTRIITAASFRAGKQALAQLAADTEEEAQVVILIDETGEAVGKLSHDYATASLEVHLTGRERLEAGPAEVHFKDGTSERGEIVPRGQGRVVLLARTRRTEDQVDRVVVQAGDPEGQGRR